MMNQNNEDNKNKKEIDHGEHPEFDGIKENDNAIPLWFNLLMIGSILFGGFYMVYYHILQNGKPLETQYLESMGKKSEVIEEFDYSKNFGNQALIAKGKSTYETNCAACHGDKGQGTVGPNLTDDYWIYGNTPQDVEKIIAEGSSAKGMPSWKSLLGDKKIRELVVYIASLQNTNPANAKPPEGKPGKLQ